MAKTPFEVLMDGAEWRELPEPSASAASQLHATHEGILRIGGKELLVYQMSDGQRMIEEASMLNFFGAESTEELLSPFQEPPC